ncbi:MAG: VWA domain-containing protein [Bacteroidota bacterium]
MLEFEYIWMFLLIPLPIIIWFVIPPYKDIQESIRIPFFEEISSAAKLKPSEGAVILKLNWMQRLLAPIVWVLLVAAIAKPQWVDDPIIKIESARDLLLAVDISQSMEARDYTDSLNQRVDRLTVVKEVLDDFITKREGDRLGLILFGGGAYPQIPFTLDFKTYRLLLKQAEIGMAGPQTVIGDAIGLGIKMFEQSEVEERILILLTDGNDTGSKMPPLKAAEIAKQNGIVIHTIGIGDPSASGENKVDLEAIKEIASITGGKSYRGDNRKELEGIYSELDKLNPQNYDTQNYRPKHPLYFYPLGLAILLIVLYHFLLMLFVSIKRVSNNKFVQDGAE